MTTTSQVLPVEQMSVEGTVEQNKFESMIGRTYSRQEGESMAKAVAIGVIVFPLLPLLALYDAVRYGLFQYGKCDGKSWSLIDKANKQLAILSAKVNAATEKKELTIEDLNAQSEQRMRHYAKQIVDGFRALNQSQFFDSSKAMKGEKQIARGKEALAREIAAYLDRNVARSEHFAAYLRQVGDYLRSCFMELGGDDVFVANKTERKNPQPLLASFAKGEFDAFLEGNEHLARSYLALARRNYQNDQTANSAETEGAQPSAPPEEEQPGMPVAPPKAVETLVRNLKAGVDERIVTEGQSKEVMQELVQAVYPKAIAAGGPEKGAAAVKDVLGEGVDQALLGEQDVAQISENVRPTPSELAAVVVENIVHHRAEGPVVLDQMIANAADELEAQSKLDPEEKVLFLNVARDLLNGFEVKWAEEAEAAARQAQLEAEEAAALQAKLIAQGKMADLLQTLLGNVAVEQQALLGKYEAYQALAAERAQTLAAFNALLATKVVIGGTEMTIPQAFEYLEREKENASPDLFNKAFTHAATDLIAQSQVLRRRLEEQAQAMRAGLQEIEECNQQAAADIAAYKQIASAQKDQLGEHREAIEALESDVLKAEQEAAARFRQAHQMGEADPLPDVAIEPVDVEALLAMREKAQAARPSLASRLWNTVSVS